MKKLIVLILVLCPFLAFGQYVNPTPDYQFKGQVSVGTDTDSYVPSLGSAWLTVGPDSTNKGMILPRVVDTSSVADPVLGMHVFQIKDSTDYFWNGAWNTLEVGNTTVSITKSNLKSLLVSKSLTPNVTYKVTDATDSSLSVFIFAMSDSTLDSMHVKVNGYSYTQAQYSPNTDTLILTDRIYGTIRCTNGVWGWVTGPHDREGLDSVVVRDDGTLSIVYSKQNYYTGVGDILAEVDNNYPFWGVISGSSVGTNNTTISLYRSFNIQDSIYFNGANWINKNTAITNPPTDSMVFNPLDSSLTVYQHDTIPQNLSPASYSEITTYPIITNIDGAYTSKLYKSNASSFSVRFYDTSNKLVGVPTDSCYFIYQRNTPNRPIKGTQAFKTYLSQPSTNLWIQGWMRKTIN